MKEVRAIISNNKKKRKPHLKLFSHVLITFAAIYSACSMAEHGSLIQLVAGSFIFSLALFRSFALMHDASHGCVSQNVTLNNSVGMLFGAICFLPFWPWKMIHLEHHEWTGNVNRDPVMKILTAYPKFSGRYQKWLNFCWKKWVPFMAFLQHTVFWGASWSKVFRGSGNKNFLHNFTSIFLLFGIYGSAFFLAPNPVQMMLLCGTFLYLVLVEVINFPHHLDLEQNEGDSKFGFYEQYRFARSCHYSKFLSHHIFNNFNYHTEHHMFPHVPWYELGDLRDQVKHILGKNYNECLGSDWILKNRSKNLSQVLSYQPRNENTSKKLEVAA